MTGIESTLVTRVRGRLAGDGILPTRARVAAAVRDEVGVRGAAQVLAAVETMRGELLGAGPLEPLLREPGVTDVLVNGSLPVWVDRGGGLESTHVRFADDRDVRRLAVRLAAMAGRRLDDAAPCVDVRLPDGIRMHAVLPPIAASATCLSFRVPRREPMRLDDWVATGSMPVAGAELLARIIDARASFVVTGGTGTGKTTLLATLLGRVDPTERIVLVEDTGELRPDHPHVVRLEARAANIEGIGAVGLARLVREALRMRPDRLIVGEVRGGECVDLLAALNVGHDGGAGTLHANSASDVPARIEALCTAAGLSREGTHSQLSAGLRLVVHLVRDRAGVRRLDSVGIVRRGVAFGAGAGAGAGAGGGGGFGGVASDAPVEIVPAVRVVEGCLVDDVGRRELDVLLDRR